MISEILRLWKSAASDLVEIESKKALLKTLQVLRTSELRLLGMIVVASIIFDLIALVHIGLYLFLPLPSRLWNLILLAGIDVTMLTIVVYQLISEKKMMEHSNYYQWYEQQSANHFGIHKEKKQENKI